MTSSDPLALVVSAKRGKNCSHSKYKVVIDKKKRITRHCKYCGRFCLVGTKRRVDRILKKIGSGYLSA